MRLVNVFLLILVIVGKINGQDHNYGFKEVEISNGRILGRQLTTIKNNVYYGFQDIPYAKPPIGSLRLRESVPPENWEGVLNTTANKNICVQFNAGHDDLRETENCLVLNVYTPVDWNTLDKNLPVLVWIHGGSFVFWSGEKDVFGPDYFIDQKIIVVTINYRLGPLGFLSTDDGIIPGNLGLKDQLLALRWVNTNIHNFGGDPLKVTISGQSAGAASVGYHILSKRSEGLFRAAIMESGSALNCWSLHKKGKPIAQLIARELSPTHNDDIPSEEMLLLMQTAKIEDFKAAATAHQGAIEARNCHELTSVFWGPVIEDEKNENAFVTGMNHEKLKNGEFNRVPIIIGINSEESLLFATLGLTLQGSMFDMNLNDTITINMNMANENKYNAGADIRKLYTNVSYTLNPGGCMQVASDGMFTTPIARHAFLQSQYSDVYFYQFSYRGILGRYVFNDIEGAVGVAHQEELGFFWHNSTAGDLSQYPAEVV